jgi:hypothetical protein
VTGLRIASSSALIPLIDTRADIRNNGSAKATAVMRAKARRALKVGVPCFVENVVGAYDLRVRIREQRIRDVLPVGETLEHTGRVIADGRYAKMRSSPLLKITRLLTWKASTRTNPDFLGAGFQYESDVLGAGARMGRHGAYL